MPVDYSQYGQFAPLAARFKNRDDMQDLYSTELNTELEHIQNIRKAKAEKQVAMSEFAQQIDNERNAIRNSTFLSDEAKVKMNDDFMNRVKSVADLLRIPSSERDMAWHMEMKKRSTSISSDVINNDLENRNLFKEAETLYNSGKVSKTEYDRWYVNFRDIAGKGDDYQKYVARENVEGNKRMTALPMLANESLEESGIGLINKIQYNLNDFKAIPGGFAMKQDVYEKYLINELLPSVYDDAVVAFENLPDQIQQDLLNGQPYDRNNEAQRMMGVKALVLNNFQKYVPFFPSSSDKDESKDKDKKEKIDHWENNVQPYLNAVMKKAIIDKNYDGVEAEIPLVSSLIPASVPKDGSAVVDIVLISKSGKKVTIPLPIDESINGNYSMTDDFKKGNVRTQIRGNATEDNSSDGFFIFTLKDIPLEMSYRNAMQLFKNMNGKSNIPQMENGKVVKDQNGNIMYEPPVEIDDDNIIHFMGEEFSLADNMERYGVPFKEGFLTKPNERGEKFLEDNKTYIFPTSIRVRNTKEKKAIYNMSYGTIQGAGSSFTHSDVSNK